MLLHVLTTAVRNAGDILLERYNKPRTVIDKGGQLGIVTDADRASEEYILNALKRAYPRIPAVAEETWSDALPREPFFALDGLDGTGNYAEKSSTLWGISLAFVDEEGPRSGVILLPKHRSPPDQHTLIVAERCHGCQINGEPIRFGPRFRHAKIFAYDAQDPEGSVVKQDLDRLASRSDGSKKRHPPMCLRAAVGGFLTLLKERVAAYVNLHRATSIWDLAAGALAVREAGGCALAPDGSPLRWDALRMHGLFSESVAVSDALIPVTKRLAEICPHAR